MNMKLDEKLREKVIRNIKVFKNIISLSGLTVCLAISISVFAGTVELKDISEHWAKASVQNMANLGVVKGYPDNNFLPENLMTRGEFASALCNLLKETPAELPSFNDVPKNHWASKYVGTLQKNGVIWSKEYTGEGYSIDGNITRMEIVKMLVRTNPKAVEVTKNEEAYYSLTRFSDYYKLDEETKRYIGILYFSQIISGFPDKTFKLDQPATRAEIVTLLEKFMENRSKLDNPYTENKPKSGIVGNMYYVDKLDLPQYLRAYNQINNITDEELPLKYRVDNVSIFNYDTYNEDTPGYNPEYKDLMERYQVLWRDIKEEGNYGWYNNNHAAYQPDETKDLSGKNILCVEYTAENTTPHLFAMQSWMVGPKLLTQRDFDDVKKSNDLRSYNICIIDSYQIEQWENGLYLNGGWSDKKSYKVIAFYYIDYIKKPNIRDYQFNSDFNLEDIKYIGFYNPGNWLYNQETNENTQTQEQALIMKMEE